MSHEMTLYQTNGLSRGEARRVGRELARMDAGAALERARIDQVADLQGERVAAIGYVGARAERYVAALTALEVELATEVPAAAARLQWIGDQTTAAIGDVVADAARRLR